LREAKQLKKDLGQRYEVVEKMELEQVYGEKPEESYTIEESEKFDVVLDPSEEEKVKESQRALKDAYLLESIDDF
jgi:hypothetical protein